MRLNVLAAMLIIVVSAPIPSGAEQSDEKYPALDDLSFRGFAQEVLYGHGMQRTHLFDDYTEGSYHVKPVELARELPKEATMYDLELRSLVVVGPYGPLWSYDVIAFIPTQECVRVNWVLMAHARITMKSTGCAPKTLVDNWLSSIRELVDLDEPAPADEDDFDSCALLGEFGQDVSSVRRATFDCYANEDTTHIKALFEVLNTLLPKLELTYSAYPPVEE